MEEPKRHAIKLIELLNSEDLGTVRRGFALFHSLADDGLGKAVLREIDEAYEGLAETPGAIEITLSATETEIESATFSAGDEEWRGGLKRVGDTAVYLRFSSASTEDLACVLACIVEDHWDSSIPLDWDSASSSDSVGDYFHYDKGQQLCWGEPEPSDENCELETNWDDSMCWYVGGGNLYGFLPYGLGPTLGTGPSAHNDDSITIDGVDVGRSKMRLLMFALALLAGVELDKLPTVDPRQVSKEIDGWL